MNTQDLNRIAAYAVDDRDLRSNEIPSIDLYLDQILSLVAEKNAEASAMFEDRTLTSTMINNYSLLQSQPRKMPNFWMVRKATK